MKYFWSLSFFLFSSLSIAAPDCDYHFQLSNATVEVLEDSQVILQNILVNRGQNSPSGRCGLYRIYFSKGFSNSYQRRAFSLYGSSINYNLHENINQSGVLKDEGDAVNSNEFLQGSAPNKHTTYNKNFYISTPGVLDNASRSGTYYDILQVRIYGYNQSSGNYLFEESDTFTVVFYVPKKIQISLLDEGGVFDPSSTSKVLDFGILSQNQEKGADLRVLANGSYQIKVSSVNNGKLKLSQGDTIAYSLKVNNSPVSLLNSASAPVSIGSGNATQSGGDKFNLKVRITESTTHKSAGMYQDVLTITAIAN